MNASGNAITAASREAPELLGPHADWIEARGISAELARKLGLHSAVRSFQNEEGEWEKAQAIAIPYTERGRVVNHKYRRISRKQHAIDKGGVLCLWNHDCLLEDSDRPVVICEGEWDAMVAIQLGWRAVSVPNGTPETSSEDVANDRRYEYLWRARDLLKEVRQFIIATDGDGPGIALRHDLVALLGADRCSFIEYPSHEGQQLKDLNEVAEHLGSDECARVLNAAKPVPVQGIYRISDFPDPGPMHVIPIGIPGLTEHINIVLATLTVLTGWAGQGKTSLTMAIVANLLRHGVRVALGTFETTPKPVLQRRLRAAILGCQEYVIPAPRIPEADRIIEERLTIIAQMVGEDDEMRLEDVLEYARIAVQRDGAKVLILDPWNEIEHKRRPDETETEYVGRSIRAIKHFMRQYQVAVWIIAHPSKPDGGNVKLATPGLYSISGSAQWANKADYGIVYSRPNKETNIAKVNVTKVRMGLPGKEGEVELVYDYHTSSYEQFIPSGAN